MTKKKFTMHAYYSIIDDKGYGYSETYIFPDLETMSEYTGIDIEELEAGMDPNSGEENAYGEYNGHDWVGASEAYLVMPES